MNVGELVEALEAIPYGESLPVLVANSDGALITIGSGGNANWLTPTAARFDEDRVIITLGLR